MVYDFVWAYFEMWGHFPTKGEIARIFDISRHVAAQYRALAVDPDYAERQRASNRETSRRRYHRTHPGARTYAPRRSRL